MFTLSDKSGGVPLYQSSLLLEAGFIHGFTTRVGSPTICPHGNFTFAANNREGTAAGGNHAEVEDNFEILKAAISCAEHKVITVKQVHGCGVVNVGDSCTSAEADALVTREAERLLAVRTADCLALLVGDRNSGAVAAIHAGWRGLVAGAIGEGIGQLLEVGGSEIGDVVVAIGPGIGVEYFEVGDEVVKEFEDAGLGCVVDFSYGEKAHVDLAGAAVMQLRGLGVGDDFVDVANLCTFANEELFFSYRRDAGKMGDTGRMVGAIAVKR